MKRNGMNGISGTIWKRTKLDHKGRIVLPQALRQYLGLHSGSEVLWIQIKRKDEPNLFLVEVGVKK